jgi:hypothetical protein
VLGFWFAHLLVEMHILQGSDAVQQIYDGWLAPRSHVVLVSVGSCLLVWTITYLVIPFGAAVGRRIGIRR